MPIQKVGLNLSGLQNITLPVFDIKNNTKDFINDIPVKANEISGGWWGFMSLSALFLFLWWKLHQEQADGGDYGYSNIRSMGIASSICSTIGLYALNFGYFANYYHVVIFIVVSFICLGITWKAQN